MPWGRQGQKYLVDVKNGHCDKNRGQNRPKESA